MAKPISIDFDADTRAVIRETDNLADALEDVAGEIKDLAKDADKSGDNISDSMRDAAKSVDQLEDGFDDGARAAKDLETRVSAAFKAVAADARDAGRNVEKSTKDGFKGASEGVRTLSEESKNEAREMASSFDGSAESISDMFQSMAANVFEGFGPAGAAAGIAAAVGLGVVISKLTEVAEANTEAKEAAGELAREWYDAGGAMDGADLSGKLADIAFQLAQDDSWIKFGDNAKTNVDMVRDALGETDDALAALSFKGMAGDTEAAAQAQEQLAQMITDANDEMLKHQEISRTGATYYDAEGQAHQRRKQALEALAEQLAEQSGVEADAIGQAEYYAEIMGESAEATQGHADAAEAAAQATQDLADALTDSADNAMGATESGLNWVETLEQMTADVAANGQTLDINTEAGRANMQSLVDLAEAANGMRDAQLATGAGTAELTGLVQSQRDAFIATAEAAGMDAAAAAALADTYGLIPGNVETLVAASGTEEVKEAVESIPEAKDTDVTVSETGTSDVQAGLDSVLAPDPVVEVSETGTSVVQLGLDAVHANDVTFSVGISNLWQVQAQLDALTATRTMYVDVVQRGGVSAP